MLLPVRYILDGGLRRKARLTRLTYLIHLIHLLLIAFPFRAGAERPILLQSHFGSPAAEVLAYVDFIVRTLGKRGPRHGETLRQEVEQYLSFPAGPMTPPGGLASAVEEGRREFIEGEFTGAIAQLEEVVGLLRQRTALVVSDQTLRDTMHRALLFLAHAYLRTRQEVRAAEKVREAIRSFPDERLSLLQFGPELVKLYREIRREMDQRARSGSNRLIVSTRPPGCMVFLNERYMGLSPLRLEHLYPGPYRIYVQRPRERGRVRLIEVGERARSIEVDFDLDRVLQTEEFVGFRFGDRGEMERREVSLALTVGRALRVETVFLVGVRRYQGRKSLVGSAISSSTGSVVRTGMVVIEPVAPAPEALTSLGRFLLAGEIGVGVIVRHVSGPSGEHEEAVGSNPRRRVLSARVFKWVSLGGALLALAAGVPLLALHDRGACNSDEGIRCPEKYDTLLPGVLLTAGGGLFTLGAGVLFYLDASPGARASPSVTIGPWVGKNGAGLGTGFRF